MYKPIQFLFPSSGDTYIVHDFTSQEQKKKFNHTPKKKEKNCEIYSNVKGSYRFLCRKSPQKLHIDYKSILK